MKTRLAGRRRWRWLRRLLFGPWALVLLVLLVVIVVPLPNATPFWFQVVRQPVGVVLFVVILGIALVNAFYDDPVA